MKHIEIALIAFLLKDYKAATETCFFGAILSIFYIFGLKNPKNENFCKIFGRKLEDTMIHYLGDF